MAQGCALSSLPLPLPCSSEGSMSPRWTQQRLRSGWCCPALCSSVAPHSVPEGRCPSPLLPQLPNVIVHQCPTSAQSFARSESLLKSFSQGWGSGVTRKKGGRTLVTPHTGPVSPEQKPRVTCRVVGGIKPVSRDSFREGCLGHKEASLFWAQFS